MSLCQNDLDFRCSHKSLCQDTFEYEISWGQISDFHCNIPYCCCISDTPELALRVCVTAAIWPDCTSHECRPRLNDKGCDIQPVVGQLPQAAHAVDGQFEDGFKVLQAVDNGRARPAQLDGDCWHHASALLSSNLLCHVCTSATTR